MTVSGFLSRLTEKLFRGTDFDFDEEKCSSLQDLLKQRAESSFGRYLFFYGPGDGGRAAKQVSYELLYREATRNSHMLTSLPGFEEENPVLLYLDDHWDAILWFWSVLLANGIPVLLPRLSDVETYRERHLEGLSELFKSSICVTKAEMLPMFKGCTHSLKLHSVESLLDSGVSKQSIARTYTYSREEKKMRLLSTPKEERDLAFLLMNSENLRIPKAICLKHGQILTAISKKASVRQLPQDGAFLNWMRLDNSESLIDTHLQALCLGVDQVHVRPANIAKSPMLFLDLLSKHRVSRAFAPNSFLAKLVATYKDVPFSPLDWDFSGLVLLVSGGETNYVPTCVAASSLLARYGAPRDVITPSFSMPEICGGAIFNLTCPKREVSHRDVLAQSGCCMDGIEIRSMDITGFKAMPWSAGNIEVRGPIVFENYYRNSTATDEAFTSDGWFRTGYMGRIDLGGEVYVKGRSKEFININGVDISAENIRAPLEAALEDTSVCKIICFGSKALGAPSERVTIAYFTQEWPPKVEDMFKIDKLSHRACEMINPSCKPLVFGVSPKSFPLVTAGYKPIAQWIAKERMRPVFDSGAFDEDIDFHSKRILEFKDNFDNNSIDAGVKEAETLLRKDITETKETRKFNYLGADISLADMGFTSIDIIRLKARIEARLGTTVATTTIMNNPTVQALAAALANTSKQEEEYDYNPVVVLNPAGIKTPLWLVHSEFGEVLPFVGLAQHLAGNDRPVYALRARGFEPGQDPFASLNKMVNTYVTAIRERQPVGPYAIAGHGYGATLAYEITQGLNKDERLKRGEDNEVKFLGIFNFPPYIEKFMHGHDWNTTLLQLADYLGIVKDKTDLKDPEAKSSFQNASHTDALLRILALADHSRVAALGVNQEGLARWTNVAHGLRTMATTYQPIRGVASADVFYAQPPKGFAVSRDDWVYKRLDQWKRLCWGRTQFHEVQGEHDDMLGKDNISNFAQKLQDILDARGL
ncbi:acetyl-CoA synthetase-like protein [Daldinia sp. FL1419]|nr:acetyl-CoA synthetase-like protein [Daldinia sp. FL1419]